MKFKYSFVTNSSSTSFVVLGISKYIENLKEPEKLIKKICTKVGVPYKKPNPTHDNRVTCLHDGHLDQYVHMNNSRLIASFGSDQFQLMIGIPFHKIGDNEIFGCVKDYVVSECQRLFNIEITREDIDVIEETWYS